VKKKIKTKKTKKSETSSDHTDATQKSVLHFRHLADMAEQLQIQCLAAANELSTATTGKAAFPLTGYQAGKLRRFPTAIETPLGMATAPPDGEIPPPKDGDVWTAEELADPKFTRPVLAKLLTELGGESKGKMAPTLRSEILQHQAGSVEKKTGECEVTGETDVEVVMVTYEGDEYWVSQKVLKAVEAGDAQWSEVFEGTFDDF
jgi:hypothetical protein